MDSDMKLEHKVVIISDITWCLETQSGGGEGVDLETEPLT